MQRGADDVGGAQHDGLDLGVAVDPGAGHVVHLDGVGNLRKLQARAQRLVLGNRDVVARVRAVDMKRRQHHQPPHAMLHAQVHDLLRADDVEIEALACGLFKASGAAQVQHAIKGVVLEDVLDDGLVVVGANDLHPGQLLVQRRTNVAVVDADYFMPRRDQHLRDPLRESSSDTRDQQTSHSNS